MKKIKYVNQHGVTLLELLTTLVILGIVSAIALPSYNNLMQRNKHKSEVMEFLSGLASARSEAVKRGFQTVICTSSDGASCDPSVGWESGWIAFVDTNTNNTADSGETLIRIGDEMDLGFTLRGSANVSNIIQYDSEGDSSASGTLTVCDNRGVDEAEAIIITASGKPKVSEKAAGGAALACP